MVMDFANTSCCPALISSDDRVDLRIPLCIFLTDLLESCSWMFRSNEERASDWPHGVYTSIHYVSPSASMLARFIVNIDFCA